MVRDLDVPVKLIVVPTVRDRDGVALSSRNVYLSPSEREVAVKFAITLQVAAQLKNPEAALKKLLAKTSGHKLDYVQLVGDRLCAAVYVGKTRLIDNERIMQPLEKSTGAVAADTTGSAAIVTDGRGRR